MERNLDHWSARLPANLKEHVVWPVRVEAHHDDGVPASKWRGYDALGLLCYYRHSFSQWDAAFDDEDRPLTQLLREEHFECMAQPGRDLGAPRAAHRRGWQGGRRGAGQRLRGGRAAGHPAALSPWPHQKRIRFTAASRCT
jgi:hypothetical protein